ncbi:MAG: spermidine/putrescine ABC transporter substrate-binding protein [Oscillospiraceae bacterium]|jgi:spermidine/putrescine transport system substrate-binding protein
MKKFFPLVCCVILVFSLFTACKESEEYNAVTTLENISDYDYSRLKGENITLNVANWGEYMSVNDDEVLDVNKAFEELTGIEVNYKTVPTNEELYAKLQGGADYDVIIPSDYMISRLAKENMLQKLDYDNIPNFQYINSRFVNPDYDSANEYSVPYMWGLVCIVYNTSMIEEEIDSWDALWDEKYKDKILMPNNPRDAFGIALLKNGYSLNTENADELNKALESLKEQKPLLQAYVMDEIYEKMEGGSAAIGSYYVGDVIVMCEENEDLAYVLPKEGTNSFVDAMCIPTAAKNKEAAEMYINFLCETEIALANCEYIGYSTPHTEAYELLDEETKNNHAQYPDAEYLDNKTEGFQNLSDETNKLYDSLWNELKIDEKSFTKWVVPVVLILSISAVIIINIIRSKKRKKNSL